MSKVVLTVSTAKPMDIRTPSTVTVLALDNETSEVVLDIEVSAAEWWGILTGQAVIIENRTVQ